MTIEKLLELAKLVFPNQEWVISNQTDPVYGEGSIPVVHVKGYPNWYADNLFSPSLTGEDWQQAQALQCIVAAIDMGSACHLTRGKGVVMTNSYTLSSETVEEDDLLSASISALLKE